MHWLVENNHQTEGPSN